MSDKKRISRVTAAPAGQYLATCKEKSVLSAAMNGHSAVFPQAHCTVARGQAVFKKNGVEVWRCNSTYAAAHFLLTPLAPKA